MTKSSSNNKSDFTPIAAMAGLGVAVGAAAFGAFLAKRHSQSGSGDDAPFYTAQQPGSDNALVGRTVTIRKPRSELYAHWRDFSNLPHFMENVESIIPKPGAEGHAVWTIKAPAGHTVEIETQVTEDQEDERIAWCSVGSSDISTHGYVSFADAPGDRGTRVTLFIAYDPPGGDLGQLVAKAFLREPEVQARHDLKRFKMLMETGEIATSANRQTQTRAAQQENA